MKRGLLAGLLTAVIGGAVVWWFVGDHGVEPSPEVDSTSRTHAYRIADVKPQIVAQRGVIAEKPKKKTPFWKVDASETNGFTDTMLRKWEMAHRPPPAYTNDSSRYLPRSKYAIFKYRSENEIACLLTMEPGETLVGTPTYRGYTKDFLKSCEEPIVVDAEDDEETRNLKRLMNETKIELRQRMAEGEKLEDILTKTREEYQQLAAYKSTLNAQFRELTKNSDLTDQDVEDFVTASNMMLEQKGIAPLKLGLIAKKRLQNLKQKKESK